jgi:hypothetical protein
MEVVAALRIELEAHFAHLREVEFGEVGLIDEGLSLRVAS